MRSSRLPRGARLACACYLPAGVDVEGIADSKTITTEKAREAIYEHGARRAAVSSGVRRAVAGPARR